MIKALFGTVIALSSVLAIQPATANSACTYTNLYADMAKSDPQSYQEIKSVANATANSRGIFWQVSHPTDNHVSWLFGTMHKSDPRITKLASNVEEALLGSTTYAGELDWEKTAYEMGLIMGKNPELMFQQNGEKLSDGLSVQTVEKLDELLNQRGADFDQIEPMQPWISASLLANSLCDIENGVSEFSFLDRILEVKAREAGLSVVGLETVEQQINSINAIDDEFFLNSLEDAAQQYEDGIFDDILQTASELYVSEEIGAMLPLMMHYSHTLKEGEADMLSFQRELLDDRNAGMVEKSIALHENGPSFIAVGALHLVGETGLVEGFRNAGYAVERVELER